jgi:hypothetical protein
MSKSGGHTMSPTFFFCKWCGKSLENLVDSNRPDCLGTHGVLHIDYLRHRREFSLLMRPIHSKIFSGSVVS